ncbi:hypothetical protein EK904_008153, partial [Melospiza melodia maxima]
MEPSEGYDVICCIPAASLAYNQPAMCYTLVSIPQDDPTAVACTFSCTMRFTVRDCDPSTGVPEEDGYEDEYVPCGVNDLIEITPTPVLYKDIFAQFGSPWRELWLSLQCMMDSDDEVRDRATFYLNVLQQRQLALNAAYIFNGLTVSVPGMEKALHQYTLEPSEKPFDMKTVPLATAPILEQKA